MVSDPDKWIDAFAKAGADQITVHVEACVHLQRTLSHIRSLGKKAGVALNPSTPEESIKHVLHDADTVLVMTVNPGFGGQNFLPNMITKIESIHHMILRQHAPCQIEVDGGIDAHTAPQVVGAGASGLVAGHAVFKSPDYTQSISGLRSSPLRIA
jgi:ribulose-phosphate 3-epimerase